jgi:hypothetical protein
MKPIGDEGAGSVPGIIFIPKGLIVVVGVVGGSERADDFLGLLLAEQPFVLEGFLLVDFQRQISGSGGRAITILDL